MAEPDVTLTDYGLALLALILVIGLLRGQRFGPVRSWLIVFFAAAGAAPLFGGTVHGFFEREGTTGHDILWIATLVSIGVAAWAAWAIGARLALREGTARGLIGLATFLLLGYAGAVIAGARDFSVAVAFYLPAALFLLAAVWFANRRTPHLGFRLAIAGLLLTFIAAAVQRMGLGLHPTWFDHNALYHVVQAVALVLFYRGMTGALRDLTG